MQTSKFILYLGLNDKESKKQEITTIDAFKIVSKLIATRLGGGTISESTGIYTHENGEIVFETTFKIELFTKEKEEVDELIQTLKEVFNQESIIKQTEIVNTELV